MSLINDALKRAKHARPETPAQVSPNIPFRPVESGSQPARHGLGVLLPVALAAVGLLTLLLFWELSKRESLAPPQPKGQLAVAARTLPSSEAQPAATEDSGPGPSTTSVAATSAFAKPAAGSTLESAAPLSANPPSSSPSAIHPAGETNSLATESVETNHAVTELSPPAPPPLKLQSIVFNPRRPSAMLNGRIVFVGDHIRDLLVTSIHQEYVVLVGTGRTNILSLEP
jgi:hypothetical protein